LACQFFKLTLLFGIRTLVLPATIRVDALF
jgi:hypothetical protein